MKRAYKMRRCLGSTATYLPASLIYALYIHNYIYNFRRCLGSTATYLPASLIYVIYI